MSKKKPLVSIIIPVYNCEGFIQRCLDSVFNQTIQDFEVIAINDGSTDSSLEVLRYNEEKHKNLVVLDQENHGQGYTRNRALDLARGEYILFVDSDDFLEPLTLELCLNRAKLDQSDVVHFDWKFSSLDPERQNVYEYVSKEPYAHKYMLEGGECDELLQMPHYFTVNNLYKKSFLDAHNIRYGKTKIYEDIIFLTLVGNRAKRISLLHSPLYIIYRNMESTTRQKVYDDSHYKNFIGAMKETLGEFSPRTKRSMYYLVKYFQTKFIFYYKKRVPRQYRDAFLHEYVDVLSGVELSIPENTEHPERIMRMSLERNVFVEKKYNVFSSIIFLKTQVLSRKDKVKGTLKKVKRKVVSATKKDAYSRGLEQEVARDSIVFLGFNFEYKGNSRYLFERMIQDDRFRTKKIKFITNDVSVAEEYRLSPEAVEMKQFTSRAEVVIAESWVPGWIEKRQSGSVWFQLWHGTPLKRMLFDSHEAPFMLGNENHKTHKYKDVQRWDYLLADSAGALEKFTTSFLFPKERIIQAGYPRVEYLLEVRKQPEKVDSMKQNLGISDDLSRKKIVLYAPTWRDYNHKKELDADYDYVLDVNTLAKKLGEDYLVLVHDHSFLASGIGELDKNCMDVSNVDVQEVLAVSDHVISDYSSIIFDAFACDIPVSMYATDFDKYEKVRGVYGDMWQLLGDLRIESIDDLAKKIQSVAITDDYRFIKEKYIYDPKVDIMDIIAGLGGRMGGK